MCKLSIQLGHLSKYPISDRLTSPSPGNGVQNGRNGKVTVTRYSNIFMLQKHRSQVSNQVRKRTRKNRQVTCIPNVRRIHNNQAKSILAGLTHKKRAVTKSRFKLAFNAKHES